MALLEGVDGIIRQKWGPPAASVASLEPEMWADAEKAYWPRPDGQQPFPGSIHYRHFHPGVDIANVEGTPIVAREDGVVTIAGFKQDPGSDPPRYTAGIVVEVEIRPGTGYGSGHCSRATVRVGQKVKRGQVIGYVGSTGATTGPHAHTYVWHVETSPSGIPRTFLFDPALFQAGGRLADVSWIQPLTPPPPKDDMPVAYAVFNPPCQVVIGSNVNIRSGPGFKYPVIVHTSAPTSPIWLSGFVTGDEYDVGTGTMNLWYSYRLSDPRTPTAFDGRWVYFAKPLCRITKRG